MNTPCLPATRLSATPRSPADLHLLLSRQRRRMLALARRICRDPGDAEDAVQDACLAALKKHDQLRDAAAAPGWLLRITCNAALLVLRRRRPHLSLSLPAVSARLLDPAPLPDERCEHRRRLARVCEGSAHVSPILLHTLYLREVLGLSGQEVAVKLGVTHEVVKTRIHRARAAMAA